jgi:hypothetical protein
LEKIGEKAVHALRPCSGTGVDGKYRAIRRRTQDIPELGVRSQTIYSAKGSQISNEASAVSLYEYLVPAEEAGNGCL